jgi:hypothetical protein
VKAIFLFLCIVSLVLNSASQNAEIKISGRVFDINSEAPLVNATIKIKGKDLGSSTNEVGEFHLISSKLPVVLEISYVGYETQEHTLEFEPLQPLVIQLKPKTELLKGVVITIEKVDTVFMDKHYSVLDYKLLPKGILLLIFRYTLNRSEILYNDYDGNNISSINILPGKPLRMFKDCLGEVHLFTKNKSYQVFFDDTKLKLYPPVDLNDFFQIMQYCELIQHNKLYYHEKGYLDLINIFYTIDTNNNKQNLFYLIKDQEKLDFLTYNPENLSLLNPNFTPSLSEISGLALDGIILNKIRNMEVELRFNEMAYFPAIYTPMFKLGDSILIFNHPNSTIDFFDKQDTLIGSTNISYHNSGNNDMQNLISSISRKEKWQKEVYIDQDNKKAYTAFLNLNGTKTIKEINLHTGQLIRSVKIPFPYVENINISKGFIYYIYKGWGETQKKKLFRQKIE